MNRFLRLALLLSAPLAFATPPEVPAEVTAAKATIEKDFVDPLGVKERKSSRMTRSRQPAMARRVRMLDAQPRQDAAGKQFLTFAIDAKYGYDAFDDEFLVLEPKNAKTPKPTAAEQEEKRWQKDAITGCLYAETGEIFVNRSGTYYPAALLLGKKATKAAQGVCMPGSAQVAAK